jgi:Tfp pilus assembly PilM family ATPase
MTDCGVNRQAKAMADELEMPTESIEAAFKAKTHHGDDLDADEEFYDTIRSVCEAGWRRLLSELDAPFTYVRHQYGDAEFKRVLLTGQGAALAGVAPFFAQALQLPVQPLRPTDILNAIGGLAERADDPSLITAIGLAQFDG